MTVFVFRDGELIPKGEADRRVHAPPRSSLAAPMISRMSPFESPVTGKEITSWGERERDMRAVDAVDPRDFGSGFKRGRAAQAKERKNG